MRSKKLIFNHKMNSMHDNNYFVFRTYSLNDTSQCIRRCKHCTYLLMELMKAQKIREEEWSTTANEQ